MNTADTKSIALDLFQEIRGAFPELRAELQLHHPHVDLSMDIPRQPGLQFSVNLNLQGDELHLTAGDAFWAEWFPCTDPKVSSDYIDAVKGLVSGEFRIIEYQRSGRTIKAVLERPTGESWSEVAQWSKLHLPLPWRTTQRVLQNQSAASGAS